MAYTPKNTPPRKRVVGKCTLCGSIEVYLNQATGTTAIPGESDRYPTGYGCELCD